jgi:hypothetical protein
MRSAPLGLLCVLAACGSDGGPGAGSDPDAAIIPAFRNPVDLPDEEVALQALQLLGAEVEGADRNCDSCHGLTRTRLAQWEGMSEATMTDCLTDLEVTDPAAAAAMIDCLREEPGDPDSPFSAQKLGFYATGAELDWFRYLFDLGDDTDAELIRFVGGARMPRGGDSFDQGEFDIVAEWVARGLPLVDQLVPEDPDTNCEASVGAEVAAHVAAMATDGWAARNAEAGINMLGCAGAATPRDCLTDFPDAADTGYGAAWAEDLEGSVLRVLHVNGWQSDYWSRASADGRFFALGGNGPVDGLSTIIDLAEDRVIGTAARYDPGFFPDNSGFVFQGQDAGACDQRILTREPYDDYISYTEDDCNILENVALYQHVGVAGDGDYWTAAGQFNNDDGGHDLSYDPPAQFGGSATVRLTPLTHDGTTYQEGTECTQGMPYEGDVVMSPSTRLLVGRVNSGGEQAGYRLHRMTATPGGGGCGYQIAATEIGRYCHQGGKAAFSYDERWMVIHHYVTSADAIELGFSGPGDPDFAPYLSQGAANVYLIDLLTGDKTRITRMSPGQYALFPHFRSDGWIYFNVRTFSSTEYVVASDAALLAAGD